MKWLFAFCAILFIVTPAIAQTPYIAVVGNDIEANQFYLEPEYQQFLSDQSLLGLPACDPNSIFPGTYNEPSKEQFGAGCEQFRSVHPQIEPEICDTEGEVLDAGQYSHRGKNNAQVRFGSAGWFEWYVRLPKKPNAEINLCIQCGLLKFNFFYDFEFEAVAICAAETGERWNDGFCRRQDVTPGVNPIRDDALPMVTAIAYPGPNANPNFPSTGFKLTAFKIPSTHDPSRALPNPLPTGSYVLQIFDGSAAARIVLKSCLDTCVMAKLPVNGQVNALAQTEYELEAGDIIYVRMEVPLSNQTDIYCHAQSLKVMGVGLDAGAAPTRAGTDITTSVDMGNGNAIATTFTGVSFPGNTYVTTSTIGPRAPEGFQFGNPPTYYEITTKATYTRPLTVCITYDPKQYTHHGPVRLFHAENGTWVDVTTSRDASTHTICGQVNSLSPFAIAEGINQPPVAQCQNVTVPAGWRCTASASIDNGSYDPDGDSITLTQSPIGPYPLGSTLVNLKVTDSIGASSQCTGTVTVIDTTPPMVTSASASPSILWPPDYKMVEVTVNYSATDNCGQPACSISRVTGNEPISSADYAIRDAHHVQLKAKRLGAGNGRVYTIITNCTDASGNASIRPVTVFVPHDQGE